MSDVPGDYHFRQYDVIRDQIIAYRLRHEGIIDRVGGSGECKIMAQGYDSERHPDLAVYRVHPPKKPEELWYSWIPALVIEIVSRGSEIRDYHEKAEEYLAFGVLEYWVVDANKQQLLVHRRVGGQWRKQLVRTPETYVCEVLPGFTLKDVCMRKSRKKPRSSE